MEKRIFTKEFKQGVARMVVDEKKKGAEVARDLGVSQSSVTKWVRDYKQSGTNAFPGKGHLTPEDEKIRKLEKENRLLRMERDLLKKTMGLFAGDETRNSLQ